MNTFYYVYILESISNPGNFHTGYTGNIEDRLIKHNKGGCPHTVKLRPWQLKNYFAFDSKAKAVKFVNAVKK